MPEVTALDPGRTIRLGEHVLGIERDAWRIVDVPQTGRRGPTRIDGHTVGTAMVVDDGPHDGEMHPDGDELLYVFSGRITVHLELPEGARDVPVGPGEALVVPRGIWHLIRRIEPALLLHITPGPNGEARPRRRRPGARS
jgi:mannose-6-phosphate isomerase-like protein (cupin superfamily)